MFSIAMMTLLVKNPNSRLVTVGKEGQAQEADCRRGELPEAVLV